MAPLPKERVTCTRPFSNTGVDFADPLTIRSGFRGRPGKKAWITIFVCFSTKAVHIEAVEDLTSSAFIAILRRFCSRRGKPNKIWSDNGTNFVGARRELAIYTKDIESQSANEGINWHFKLDINCTLWRNLGKLWGPITLPPEPDLTSQQISGLRRWRLVQALMQTFWSRWTSEYLPQIQVTGKWTTASKTLAIGEVVIVKEDNMAPYKWKMARIICLHTGKDGHTRVVTIRTANGTEIKRPVINLCYLPVEKELENN
ncbi:PREDICTED: uncharacterized protein LOC107172143 [Diuraphis noxia]|uniref:uncharacterized protein LOC107172143 n=1 Tax=Diuraphis noxia TaxID=143948 RepID=UPI0007639CD7|nr:PREDICTED: uncharacterized protein LOC107172143 [Diuraphis noxia]